MKKTLLFMGVALVVGWSTPTTAQENTCGYRDVMVEKLGSIFNETQISIALTAAGAVMEIFVSPKGTFSVLFTNPGEPTCLVISGRSWDDLTTITGTML